MPFEPLPQAQEDELHSARLLNVEERHYKRVFKTLLARTNPINEYISRKPTPRSTITAETDIPSSPASEDNDELTINGSFQSPSTQSQKQEEYTVHLAHFRRTVQHDHTSLLSNLARYQFLLRQNASEVARYNAQTTSITRQCHDVKRETAALRTRLQHATSTMETRRKWDAQAEAVLHEPGSGERRRTRAELGGAMEKLRAEIEELEREGEELRSAWQMRRDVFGDVVREGQRLKRVVRNEAEKAETEEDSEAHSDAGSDAGSAVDHEGEGEGEQKRREEDDPMNTGDQTGGQASHIGTPLPGTPRPHHDLDMAVDDMGTGTPAIVPEVTVTGTEQGAEQTSKDVDMT